MALEGMLSSGGSSQQKETYAQFEECDVKECIYYNEAGYCSFETCRIKNENPATADMVMKTCKFCGNQFTTNMNKMTIQVCPTCLDGCLKAEGHPHDCVICGASMDKNPSIFFPVCSSCLGRIRKYIDMWHCEACG